MSKTKIDNNEQYNDLSKETELSIDKLKQISKDFDDIKKLLEKIDSKEKLKEYIKYLEKKEKNTQNNELIEDLKEICTNYKASKWMEPMLKKLKSVKLKLEGDDFDTACSRNKSYSKIELSFNKFSIELEYFYERDYHIDCYGVEVEIEEMIEYFELPKEEIKTFNKIMLEWIVKYNTHKPHFGIELLEHYVNLYD